MLYDIDDIDTPTSVPVSDLVVASENPRSAETVDDARISDLADNIETLGLITPLIGYTHGDTAVMVTAGGRRTRALQRLSEESRIPADMAVPVLLLSRADAITAGHAEQLTHQKLSPTDELRIFEAHPEASDKQLARIVGTKPLVVKQRRAILSLPEQARAAVFAGEITVDQAAGLTYFIGDDDAILSYLEDCKRNPHLTLSALRRIFEEQFSDWNHNTLSQIVSADAYTGAGGRFQEDLFTDTRFILDPDILRSLARESAYAEIAGQHPGWGDIVELPPDANAFMLDRHPGVSTLSEDDEAWYLEHRHGWFMIQDDDERARVQERLRDLEERRKLVYPDKLKHHLKLCWRLTPTRHDPYEIVAGVLPDDLESLYAQGWIERPTPQEAPATDHTDAETALSVSGALNDRIRRIRRFMSVQVMARDVNLVLGHYVSDRIMNGRAYDVMPQHSFQPDERDARVLSTSTAWDKMDDLTANPDAVAAGKPADQRMALAKMILDCLRPDAAFPVEITPAVARQVFTPDADWFKSYKKPQLLHMLRELEIDFDERAKAGELAARLAELWTERKDWLPLGFA